MARTLSTAVRADMLSVARRIVVEEGPQRCTVEAVANGAGVARTTVYRHFGDADGVVLAVLDGMVVDHQPVDTGSLAGDLRVIQHRYLAAAGQPVLRRLFVWMLMRSADDAAFATRFRRVRVQPGGPTTIALQRAIARGELRPDMDLALALHIIQGPFLSKQIIENEMPTDIEFDTLIERIVCALRNEPHRGVGDDSPR
jgi:AcrR family transcriptional regulator